MRCEVAGTGVHYTRSGAGRPIVLLHGWGCSTEVMRPIADHLQGRFEVISLDFPGFGASDDPPQAWGVPEYAQCTVAVLGQLGVERPILLGHSFGGRVLLHMAGALAYDADRLILVDAAGVRAEPPAKKSMRQRFYAAGKAFTRVLPSALGEPMLERLKQRFGSADYRAARGVMRDVLVKTVNYDLTPLLPQVRQEALLIWGERDTATPLWQARRMEQALQHAGLAVIGGAGHYCFLDQPALFCSILDSYLAPYAAGGRI